MGADRERWDAKHAAARGEAVGAADPFVAEHLQALAAGHPGGRAVDLACGRGRHALALHGAGFRVEAWDVSPVALAELAERAPEIVTRAVDLAGPLPDVEPFDLVVCVSFLDRGLFARLAELVAPGGHALVATFTLDRPGQHPRREWCLERGELARGLPGLVTVAEREADGRAGLLARRPE